MGEETLLGVNGSGYAKRSPGGLNTGWYTRRKEGERKGKEKRERDGVPAREALFVPYTYIL